jgi:hypothetical protein
MPWTMWYPCNLDWAQGDMSIEDNYGPPHLVNIEFSQEAQQVT